MADRIGQIKSYVNLNLLSTPNYFILLSTLVLSIPAYSETVLATNDFAIPKKSFTIDSKDFNLYKINRKLVFIDGEIVSDDISNSSYESKLSKKEIETASYCEINFKYVAETYIDEKNEQPQVKHLDIDSTNLYDSAISFGNMGLSYSTIAFESLSKAISQKYHMDLYNKEQAFKRSVLINGNHYRMNVSDMSCINNGVKGRDFSDLNDRHFAGKISLGFNSTLTKSSSTVNSFDGNREAKADNESIESASKKSTNVLSK